MIVVKYVKERGMVMKIEHDIHVHTHLSSCSSDPKATVENI